MGINFSKHEAVLLFWLILMSLCIQHQLGTINPAHLPILIFGGQFWLENGHGLTTHLQSWPSA